MVRGIDRDIANEELIAQAIVAAGFCGRPGGALNVLGVARQYGTRIRGGSHVVPQVQPRSGAAEAGHVEDFIIAGGLRRIDRRIEASLGGLEYRLRLHLRAVLRDHGRAEALAHQQVAVAGVGRGLRDQLGAVLHLGIRPSL